MNLRKATPVIGVDGIPRGIDVIVFKDTRDGHYEVFRADNGDKLLGIYPNALELEHACIDNNWYIVN